jgi:hypothetical protein
MLKYFRDLLQTLQLIERHLAVIASCAEKDGVHHKRKPALRVAHWND